ncbi:MAG: hypothetical protein PHU49_04680 [Syntrophorhabdaceae bacterium]|nr:hypothetical protein [Syntrophorhabdaceae bacterium]MDD5243291.1 hypothetical protein [Syntrophorhabdaceae bacterium]
METVLVALKDSLVLSGKLLCIILPLSIFHEFLKGRDSKLTKKRFAFLGISQNGFIPLVTGVIIGLTYGAGVIIHSIRTSNVGKKEAFLILLFLSICHAMIEDTLIFVVIGANGFILIAFRFVLAIILTYIIYRSRIFKIHEGGKE